MARPGNAVVSGRNLGDDGDADDDDDDDDDDGDDDDDEVMLNVLRCQLTY